jgi:hypothetical protein
LRENPGGIFEMTKFVAIGLVIITLAMAVGIVWIANPSAEPEPPMEQKSPANVSAAIPSGKPAEAVVNSVVAETKPVKPPEDLGLVIPGDDREPGWRIYEAHLREQVEDVVSGNVVEKSLPTPALPMLQDRLSDGTLPAATTRPIGDALAADNIRLNNALRARKRWDWYQKNLTEIFEKNAVHKKWVVPARAAVQAAVRRWSINYMASSDEEQIVYRKGKKAMDLGCDEPLMCYIWAQSVWKLYYADSDMPWVAYQGSVAVRQMDNDQSGYPPIIKLETDLIGAATLANVKPVSKEHRTEIDRLIDEAKSRFVDVLKSPDLFRPDMIYLFSLMEETSREVNGDRRLLPNSLFEQLKASRVDQSTVLTIQGNFNVNYAWDARGTGYANTVTENGAQLMAQRLERADTALEKAWQLDQTNSEAATEMLDVELGQGQGRDRMELWFNRAMTADPDNYEACAAKMNYLQPKWYGSGDEMLIFGRECFQAGNWDAGIPYMLARAHLDFAEYTNFDGNKGSPADYFRNNPQAWKDLEAVYEQWPKDRPLSNHKKYSLAQVAVWTNHWDVANRMLDETDEAMDYSIWGDDDFKKFVKEVRSHRPATQPTTQPAKF